MPYFPMLRQVALELEAVEGTAETIVAGDVIAPAYDIEWSPTFNAGDRESTQNTFDGISSVSGERSATITFSTEIKGSGSAGTAPLNLSRALQSSYVGETIVGGVSVTYAPATLNVSSATIEVRESNDTGTAKIKQLIGARGTVSFTAVKGQIVLANFVFTGRYVEPTEGSMLTEPSISPNPLPFLLASLSVHGVGTLKVQNWSMDLNNAISLINDVNEATGNFSAHKTGGIPTGQIDPLEEDIATINYWNKITSNSEGIITWLLSGSAGNIATFTANKTQFTNGADGDRDGMRMETLDVRYNRDTTVGDNSWALVLT